MVAWTIVCMTNPIARALSSITLGDPIACGNLTMIPMVLRAPAGAPDQSPLDYLTLDEALASGLTEITEISTQGSVPELRVVNKGRKPVLIVDGEELVGAKQNRVVNLTILVPAATMLHIPVSCVEAGRWSARSRAFSSAPRAQYATGRAKRMKQVTMNMAIAGERMSNQSEVWADIAEKSHRLRAHSPTSAMEAMYIDHAGSIDEYVAACQPVEGQVGALFAVDDVVIGFDLFDRETTLRRMLPKLVRSAAIDAIDTSAKDRRRAHVPVKPLSELFIAAAAGMPLQSAKAIGLGDDVRLDGGRITGAGLVAHDTVVHLAGFAAEFVA